MSRLGAKIQRERATEARVVRRLIRELLPPPPPPAAPAPERLGGAEPHAEPHADTVEIAPVSRPSFARPFEPAIFVLLALLLVALFGAISGLDGC
jgi:hypothetical protein